MSNIEILSQQRILESSKHSIDAEGTKKPIQSKFSNCINNNQLASDLNLNKNTHQLLGFINPFYLGLCELIHIK